ncbi:MAG: response regulator [Acidimicrobiia bacterium]|nr:response regulator [Acidimicrobiia bacterium]
MSTSWFPSVGTIPRRASIDRALLAIERDFIRGILWLGLAAFPILGGVALFVYDASIGLFAALALAGALMALLQLRLDRPRALPVVLVVVTIAALQIPVQSSDNRAAMMVGVAALGALGGLFVERRHLWKYLSFLSIVWVGQLIWAADQGAGVFQKVDQNELFGMAIQLGIFIVLSGALHVLWRVVSGSEKGYRNVFDRAPVSIWEEDYSGAAKRLEQLRRQGVTDLRGYLAENPELVEETLRLLRVTDVNDAAVALIEAADRDQLLGSIDPRTVDQGTLDSFVDQLQAIWDGEDRLVVEFTGRTTQGRSIDCVLHWSVPAGRWGPDFSRVLVSISDVTDLAGVQRELAKKNALLNSIANLQSEFIADVEPQVLFGRVLEDLLGLTGSAFGYVGEIHQNADGPYLQPHALSGVAWDAESAGFYTGHPAGGLPFDNLDRLSRAVITGGETVISNNPDQDVGRGERPDSYPEINSFLGVPLRRGADLVGVVGIANRPGGYDALLVTAIEPFLASCANLIVAYRSERRRQAAEQALHRTERRLRLVAENVADLLYTMSEEGTLGFISDSIRRLLGYQPHDLVDTDLFELIHPDDRAAFRESGHGVAAGASGIPFEHRMLHADGSWRLMEASAVNMLHDPEVNAWVVNSRDVTARKEAEIELQRARDAAQQAAASKAQFLANISHEIRTPMNAILGMTELTLETELSAEQREYLGTTKTSIDALLTLINDLLDLSKIEAGKLHLEEIPFSLGDTIGDTVRTMAVRAAEKGLELSVELDPAVPDAVVGDPGRVRQILFNLLGNALKFTHVGHVKVAVSVNSVSAEAMELHFVVSDTGIGIPEDVRDRIFDSFAQADGSTTRRYGGTGLGLTITADLVKMMGGKIWVESEVGAGSRFHFTARLAEAGLLDLMTPVDATDGSDLRVLVIADAVAAQRSLSEMLRQGNVATSVVTDLGAALDTMHDLARLQVKPRAVVVDVRENILETCSRITTHPDFKDIPVIAVPVAGERGDAARFRNAGVSAYLTKPVSQSELLDAVRLVTSERMHPEFLVTKHWLRERRPRLRLLLADDSPTNRMLAIRLLEKRGHSVVAVEDGLEAVEAVQEGSFDAVLMDVQMPELDGLEATQVIRQWENGKAHVPIVALTAHAMESDRQRCLEAGMDAYVSKPFSADELYATVEQLVGMSSRSERDQDAGQAEGVTETIIDRREALERVEGMTELLKEMAQLFLEEYPGLRSQIVAGFEAGELAVPRELSHRIKGTVGLFAAHGPFDAAKRMNDLAKLGDFDGTARAWDHLEEQMQRLLPELEALAAEGLSAWA